MDSMFPPPSHGNPTTFGGLTNTSLSQGVLLTVEGAGAPAKTASRDVEASESGSAPP